MTIKERVVNTYCTQDCYVPLAETSQERRVFSGPFYGIFRWIDCKDRQAGLSAKKEWFGQESQGWKGWI